MDQIKILLVDDNVVIRESFKRLLASILNLNLIGECSDGTEVIPFLKKNKTDVVFMDLDMKDMDGFEATKAVKKLYQQTKVIGFSCTDHKACISKMTASGADGFISKFDATKEAIVVELQRVMN